MDILISILALLGFVALTASTGLFVAIEFALTGLERSTVDNHVRHTGDTSAKAVKRDFENLSFVLSGAQLGITVTTLATGFLAEPILAKFFTPLLELVGLSESSSSIVALILALVVATVLSMVFGELVPKNWAITSPLPVARFVVHPVNAFNVVFKWFINWLNVSANWVVRRLGIEPADELASARSPEELSALVRHSVGEEGLDETMAEVLENSLEFGETAADELMTPRSTVDQLRDDDTVADLVELARTSGHSRFPVVVGDLDETIGVVHVKDAFDVPREKRGSTPVGPLARRIPTVPESLDGDAVLKAVRSAGSQMVLVADEYGGTSGIITIEDVVEEILGEVYDEHDDAAAEREIQQFGTSWEVSGLVRAEDLEEEVGYPAPEDGPYETLGGLIMAVMGRIPAVGDVVVLPQGPRHLLDEMHPDAGGRWLARVSAMDGRRIDRAVLTPVSDGEAEEYL
ncbi:membrane protein [Corynebacterium frankenforstense DSM 45800]|uniref:Membrane protein n=1 Tax=Corynebacterium frankenforstense DSM 45800 TaxID=1437875 RepID=A0A1L7CSY3_9CORY|nr:hemolysin family protein [Corynebacterium frankenforstense]APT88878.1 membrane protein [Corynebacterium frankenforstense DSM 45800]